MIPVARALTIAGSDSGGGAGIQADLKTFHELGVFGTSVLTALTAQNTVGVHDVHEVPPAFVTAQLDAVATDLGVDAAKTGMLASGEIVAAVADGVRRHGITRLVVDPVAASKHGDILLHRDALAVLRDELIPLAELVTPNLGEIRLLTGVEVTGVDDLARAATAFLDLGCRAVLVKGGHLPGNDDAVDLYADGRVEVRITGTRFDTADTHGTGCTLAAAIAGHRAQGAELLEAVSRGKDFVTGAIRHGLRVGAGVGPVDHAWPRR